MDEPQIKVENDSRRDLKIIEPLKQCVEINIAQ